MEAKVTSLKRQETIPGIDIDELRQAISKEYEAVAKTPNKGFHFHTGQHLAEILEYKQEWLAPIPEAVVDSFAGTGNPFAIGPIKPGETVIDIGCGAGIDSFIAAGMVGSTGRVIGVDMTAAMLDKAREAQEELCCSQVKFEYGVMEDLPVADNQVDVVISNGVLNLSPDKKKALLEMHRVLRPGGRLQVADIIVQKEVPDSAKQKIDLWTG